MGITPFEFMSFNLVKNEKIKKLNFCQDQLETRGRRIRNILSFFFCFSNANLFLTPNFSILELILLLQ